MKSYALRSDRAKNDAEVVAYLRTRRERATSYDDIAAHVGVIRRTAIKIVNRLEAEKRIRVTRRPHRPAYYEVLE